MAKLEDRFKALEKRKRLIEPENTDRSISKSIEQELCQRSYQSILFTIESDDNSELNTDIIYYCHKRSRYSKGIKITLTYTLKVNSSLREWGNWKYNIECVFKGDSYTYQTGAQKILKALDYLDTNLKSL